MNIEKIWEVMRIANPHLEIDGKCDKDSWSINIGKISHGGTYYHYETINDINRLSGYLINREFGFAEAWAKDKRYAVQWFLQEFALANDKDKWLEENL